MCVFIIVLTPFPRVPLSGRSVGARPRRPRTCDICGRRLISFRLMLCARRLLSSWHSSTPSRSVCARSKTCADSHVTRWLGGSTLQPISQCAHCRQCSMVPEPIKVTRGAAEKALIPLLGSRSLHKTMRAAECEAPRLKMKLKSMHIHFPLRRRRAKMNRCIQRAAAVLRTE